MAKGSKGRKSNHKTPQKSLTALSDSDMDDEIDVFHKQRDIVPLDLDDDAGDSDEDNEQHVFEIEDDSEDDEDEDDSEEDTGFAAKIAKQQKSLKAKIGGVADDTQDDAEDEENKSIGWGRSKNNYYQMNKIQLGDSIEEDEELEEEKEVKRIVGEKAKSYSNADYGLEDDSEEEPTFENLSKGKGRSKATVSHDETETEVVIKDPNALSKEEQMDIVYNSAPELVGLLSELNEAVEQLETKVDPVLNKLKEENILNKNGVQYMELKKQLLVSYCQAISFHLLLKSEGHPVRDHPVLARILEIKSLLDKMKPLDENLSFDVEDFLKNHTAAKMVASPMEISAVDSISLTNNSDIAKIQEPCVEPKKDSTLNHNNGGKRKRENEQIGLQSVEMLKVRAALEEKLKQKGLFNLNATKTNGIKKNLKPLNGKLEARDDFDDDVFDIDGNQNKSSSKLSQLVVNQSKKPRVISGDDDLPKRDDIGERRRKHEMRVLTNAGVHSDDDFQENDHNTPEGDDDEDGETEDGDTDSESDLYKQTKLKRDAKLAAKSQKYSRTAPSAFTAPETDLEGKRQINYEMEKNRGLTRKRNKELKNPRKKYKLKHKKKEVARKGQVREIRKPTGPYGGEVSGINTVSRSHRFKN